MLVEAFSKIITFCTNQQDVPAIGNHERIGVVYGSSKVEGKILVNANPPQAVDTFLPWSRQAKSSY